MGGTIEVAAAFQNRLIAGAVTSELRVTPPSQPKILVRLVDMGIPYSMNMIAVQREYYRRNPAAVESMVRAYADGLAFMNRNKERALKIITKYSRLSDARMIEEFYNDAVTYLDRIPRAEPEAVQTILEFMGKKGDSGGNLSGQCDRRQADARGIFRQTLQEIVAAGRQCKINEGPPRHSATRNEPPNPAGRARSFAGSPECSGEDNASCG